jgi:hypothetical protein
VRSRALVRRIGKSGCDVNSRVVAEFVMSKAGCRVSEVRVEGEGAEQYGETSAGFSFELIDGLVWVS